MDPRRSARHGPRQSAPVARTSRPTGWSPSWRRTSTRSTRRPTRA